MSLAPGSRLGDYEIVAPLGAGGMGEVYRARDAKLRREVALKVLPEAFADDPDRLARFEREAQAVAALSHAEAYELYLRSRTLPGDVTQSNNEAIALLQRAVELDPKFALGHAMLSSRYHMPGRKQREYLERGVAAARTALAIDPDLARAHYYLGVNLRWLGRMDEARVAYQRATVLDPNSVGAMSGLSILEMESGNIDQALYWVKRGFVHAPNVSYSFYSVSLPLTLLDSDICERFLRVAAERFPPGDVNSIRLQFRLAIVEWRKGDRQAALNRLRRSAQAFPASNEAQGVFTDMAVLVGAPEAADRLDREIRNGKGAGHSMYSPYTPRAWRAFLYLQDGDRSRAQPLIEAALAANREGVAAGDVSFNPPMENAVLFLMQNKRSEALDALEAGVRAGWKDAIFLRRDPLLAGLRDDPRFSAIVQQVEREVGQMRARADFSNLDKWAGAPAVRQ